MGGNRDSMSDAEVIYLRVNRKDIAFIKFVIESYEGVGIVRTLNRHLAIIVILAAPDFATTARHIIASIGDQVSCTEIPRPQEAMTDWLLRAEPEEEGS